MKSLMILFIAVSFASCGQLFLKQGMLQVGDVNLSLRELVPILSKVIVTPFVVIGLMCYGIGALLWLVVLSKIELSYAYPMVSLSYLIVVIGSIILFKENVSLIRWIGVLLVCIGVYIVARS